MTHPHAQTFRSDCLILGGGVAGLWLRWRLRREGLSVTLLDLGTHDNARQSVASQGILHRGVKYALSPGAAGTQRVLAEAMDDWTRALECADSVSAPALAGVRIYTRTMHMWAPGGMLAGVTGAAASLSLVSGVRKLDPKAAPRVLASAGFSVWETDETCIDAASLLSSLRRAADGPLLSIDAVESIDAAEGIVRAVCGGQSVTFSTGAVYGCAGLGNEHLMAAAGIDASSVCQRRPLHMVMLTPAPSPLYAHCIRPLSDKPRLTITTAYNNSEPIWYIGGDLAETGVARDSQAQVRAAREELARCLPAADLSAAHIAPWRIDRAEGRTQDGARPDGPVARSFGRLTFIWPTKLALAPIAARRAVAALFGGEHAPATRQPGESAETAAPPFPLPPEHLPPWQHNNVTWRNQ